MPCTLGAFLPPDPVLHVGFPAPVAPGERAGLRGGGEGVLCQGSACSAVVSSAGPQTLLWVFGSWLVRSSAWREGFQVSTVLQEPLCMWALGSGA